MARPEGQKTKHLTSRDRQRIRTLFFDAKCSQVQIQEITGATPMQVRGAIRASSPTPRMRSGRPLTITYDQQEQLVQFVMSSKESRRMTFLELSMRLFEGEFSQYVIRRTLYRHGFRRRVARRKPPISEKNRLLRIEFAQKYKNWSIDDWASILWTDETWVTGGTHGRVYITRRPGEEWDPTCIVEKHQRKRGWMFWGCFSGFSKGPGLFWEKEWGTVTSEAYQQHTVPLIDGWIQLCQRHGVTLVLMQDGAASHSSRDTISELKERGIQLLKWPPYSPDLNPIETCWNWMKDWLEDNYQIEENPSYDKLRMYVKEAWEALPNSFLQEQLATMPARMQAVIAAEGLHTRF